MTIDKVVVFDKEVDLDLFCNTLNAEYACCVDLNPYLSEVLLVAQGVIMALRKTYDKGFQILTAQREQLSFHS